MISFKIYNPGILLKSNLAPSSGDKLTARMEPFFTFCTCKHEAVLNMKSCSSMRHVQNIGMPVTFNTSFYQYFVVGSVCIDFSVFWSKWHCSCTFVIQKP